MNKLTYREAYDKIIEAYFNNQIIPMDEDFCFCGTLNNNEGNWCGDLVVPNKALPYTQLQFGRMEAALFAPLMKLGVNKQKDWEYPTGGYDADGIIDERIPLYEDSLFAGMSAALDVLRQIHIERGENVDEVPVFTKRKLSINAL